MMNIKILENVITYGVIVTQVLEETDEGFKVKNPCALHVDLDPQNGKYSVNLPYILFQDILKDRDKGDIKFLPKPMYIESLNEYDEDIVKGYISLEERDTTPNEDGGVDKIISFPK